MIKHVIRCVTLSFCLGSMIACAQGAGQGTSASPKIETDEQKTLYALGLLLGRNVKPFALTPGQTCNSHAVGRRDRALANCFANRDHKLRPCF